MAKGFGAIALGYGIDGNKSSTPGTPIGSGNGGQDLVNSIRSGSGIKLTVKK